MNERTKCANRSGFGHTCVRNLNHDGQHGYAGMFWGGDSTVDRELEQLKEAVLELASAFRQSADNRDFNEGYRDGCRVASRDFKALIELAPPQPFRTE